MADSNEKEVVILVVAHKPEDQVDTVDFLVSDGTWKPPRKTAAGVKIFECGSLPRVVVDTIPLTYRESTSQTDTARRWISRNGLRRILYKKDIVVVWVVPCASHNIGEPVSPFHHLEKWMKVFSLIFRSLSTAVTIVAKTEAEKPTPGDIRDVEKFVHQHKFSTENIIYSHMEMAVLVNRICLSSIPSNAKSASLFSNLRKLKHPCNTRSARPFPKLSKLMQTNAIWSPERVLLLGLTGAGKSTLAQMLTLGQRDPNNEKFPASSSVRGVTAKIQSGEGRGWFVVDTPGFGEDDTGVVEDNQARRMVNQYVKLVEGTFSHYLFVMMKGRTDQSIQKTWMFLMGFFGNDVIHHFSVIISGADDEWVDENRKFLEQSFPGCKRFFTANFPEDPDFGSPDEVERKEWHELIKDSLLRLEENLANLALVEIETKKGKWSKGSMKIDIDRARLDSKGRKLTHLPAKFATFFGSAYRSSTRLTNMLGLDDSIRL